MEPSQFSRLRKLPMLAAMLVWAFAVIAALPHYASANSVSTTNVDDSKVNQNLYDAKTDVYISGKPSTCGGVGLAPDGTYYFQVTYPSGATLLSSDPLDCRIITVTNGVITAYGPAAGGCTAHNTGVPIVDCGDVPPKVTVQMAPFDDTPNSGGVYKVWVEPTTVTLPAACDPTADEITNHDGWAACGAFDPSSSKTDNFRVKSSNPPSLQSELDLFKFCDVNGNGVLDPNELLFGLNGWTVNVTQGVTTACTGTTGTDGTGRKVCANLDPGDYDVSEVTQTGYTHKATCVDGFCGVCSQSAASCNFDVDCPGFGTGETCTLFDGASSQPITLAAGQVAEVDFGNVGGITGRKFSDLNGDGTDNSEPGVQGVQLLLTGTALDGVTPISLCTNTDANGNYSFPLTPGDNLKVTEVPPPGSIATTPLTCTGSFGDPATPSTCAGFSCSFGNACLSGNCAAKTMGWWKNSGNSSITGADLCALTALNLRDGKGNNFDPLSTTICAGTPTATQVTAGRKALATWLGNATATNMAYMLSAQFATMTLNTRHPSANCNLTGVSLYVGTPPTTSPACLGKGTGTPLVNANGFITLSALLGDVNAELGSYAITTSGKPDAVCQGFKETALDKANNSETVGGAGIIDVACPAVNNPCPTPPSP